MTDRDLAVEVHGAWGHHAPEPQETNHLPSLNRRSRASIPDARDCVKSHTDDSFGDAVRANPVCVGYEDEFVLHLAATTGQQPLVIASIALR